MDQATAKPVEKSTPARWDTLDPENAARLLGAVLRDIDNLADRLTRVANTYADLDHNQRVRLGQDTPELAEALVDVEHYHAGRSVPGVRMVLVRAQSCGANCQIHCVPAQGGAK